MSTQGLSVTTVFELIDRYLEYLGKIECKAQKTLDNRKYILTPMFAWLGKQEVIEVTIQDIDDYFINRSEQVRPSTLSCERQVLRLFLQWCDEYCELPLSFSWAVIRRVKVKPPRIRSFTRQEIGKVITSAPEIQDKLIIALLFETGMRIGELLQFQLADINGNQIQIRGKGDVDRVVCMSPFLATSIRSYTQERGIRSGHVFRPLQRHINHPGDRYVSTYAIRDRIEREFLKCGFKMHPHQLRHSFSLEYLMAGGDLRSLQLLLGHTSIETTQRYLGLTDQQLETVYQRTFKVSILSV